MDICKRIVELADGLEAPLFELRKDLHKHAESGWEEIRTSSIIAKRLTDMGYEVLVGEDVCLRESRMGVPSQEKLDASYARALEQGADPEYAKHFKDGMTGVIGILRRGEGPTVAMRFDIDALGVIESQEADHIPAAQGFASVNHGVMHSCGHDGHGCVGLGVAQVLMDIQESLHGTVKLIFQPAEEGVRGAKSIVDKGHLDGVNYFLSSHISPNNGELSDVTPGAYGSLATCKYDVTFKGKSAHAGHSPQKGDNALLAAATALLNLQAIPRSGEGVTRINVGKLVGGSGRNVIADEAFMEIEVRGQTTELNQYMCDYAQRILEAAAAMHGCTVEIRLMGAAESIQSDRDFAEYVAELLPKVGLKTSQNPMIKSGGSEDAAYMLNRVQAQGGKAIYMRVHTTTYAPSHNRRFDFSSDYIPRAIKAFCVAVYDIMK